MVTEKLGLGFAARRIFLEDGREVFDGSNIPAHADVYISTGENFKDPFGPTKRKLAHSVLKVRICPGWRGVGGGGVVECATERLEQCQSIGVFWDRLYSFSSVSFSRRTFFRHSSWIVLSTRLYSLSSFFLHGALRPQKLYCLPGMGEEWGREWKLRPPSLFTQLLSTFFVCA